MSGIQGCTATVRPSTAAPVAASVMRKVKAFSPRAGVSIAQALTLNEPAALATVCSAAVGVQVVGGASAPASADEPPPPQADRLRNKNAVLRVQRESIAGELRPVKLP